MSENDPYSSAVRRLFADTAHAGRLAGGRSVRLDRQGVRIALWMTLDGTRIEALRYQAWGCPHLIAASEAFCRDYEGRPVSELGGFNAQSLMQSLGIPVEKTGRILVLEDAVRSLGT
tara:strand:+ start:1465 stop:1815 length:351 start_codon:yes stop_codon:yes gene_type:complete